MVCFVFGTLFFTCTKRDSKNYTLATLIRTGIDDEEGSETSLVDEGDGSQELMGSSMAFQASHDAIQSGIGAATVSSSELKGLLTIDSMHNYFVGMGDLWK